MSADQLAQALIKQYLSTKGYWQTLDTFEKETSHYRQFPSKQLIYLLSLDILYKHNKSRKNPYTTLIEIITNQLSLRQPKEATRPFKDKFQTQSKNIIRSSKNRMTMKSEIKKSSQSLRKRTLKCSMTFIKS